MEKERDITQQWIKKIRQFNARGMTDDERESLYHEQINEYVARNLQVSHGNGDLRTLGEEYQFSILSAGGKGSGVLALTTLSPTQYYYSEVEREDTVADNNWKPILHQHDYFEMMTVLEGCIPCSVEGVQLCCSAGESLLIWPGVRHVETIPKNATVVFLCMASSFVEKVLGEAKTAKNSGPQSEGMAIASLRGAPAKRYKGWSGLQITPQTQAAGALLILEDMAKELLNQVPGWQEIFQGLCKRLLYTIGNKKLYSCNRVWTKEEQRDQIFQEVTAFIEKYNEQATGNALTKRFHYTSDHLNRVIKRQTGLTLSEYRRWICVKKAEKLLRDTETSVSDIIAYLGYTNRTYFYKIFQKQYGMTPQEYRTAYGKKKKPE